MFEDSLLESSVHPGAHNPQITALSFLLQLVAAGVMVLIPLLYTDALPGQQLISVLRAPAMASPERPQAAEVRVTRPTSDFDHSVLRQPSAIPRVIAMIPEEEPASNGKNGVIGAIATGEGPVIPGALAPSTPAGSAMPKLAAPEKVRVSSGVAEGMLVRKVTPNYPPLAVRAHIQGTVMLQATIGKDGMVQNLRVVSGPPLLIESAMDAVRQWRYQPFYLNGQPVEVETQINVHFTLGNGV